MGEGPRARDGERGGKGEREGEGGLAPWVQGG